MTPRHRTTSNGNSGALAWISRYGLMTVTIIGTLGGAIYSTSKFYVIQNQAINRIETLEKQVETLKEKKADREAMDGAMKDIRDRQQRQYEQNNTMRADISEIRRDAAYDKGYHDAEEKHSR